MKQWIAWEEHVKLLGRTYIQDEKLWLSLSATGIEFTFTGKSLAFTVQGSTASTIKDNAQNYARYAIYKDDVRILDEVLDQKEKKHVILDEETPVTCTIRLLKLSECAMSTLALCPIETDEEAVLAPTPAKKRKLEIIGDSITCGYGVDDEDFTHPFSTATEDVTKSYSYKTVSALDADYSIFSISGYGIISGYTDNPSIQVKEQQLPNFYPYYGFSNDTFGDSVKPAELAWDFSRFQPDAIVINLGTNDDSFCQDTLEKQLDYKDHYVQFLKEVRCKNPNATIFCILGLMGDRLYPTVVNTVEEYKKETGDTKLYALHIPPQIESDGLVSDYHPTSRSHDKAAAVLVPFIRVMMSWNDTENI